MRHRLMPKKADTHLSNNNLVGNDSCAERILPDMRPFGEANMYLTAIGSGATVRNDFSTKTKFSFMR